MILQHRRFVLLNGVALLLCLLTSLLYEEVDHYIDVGGELLQNPSFDAGLTGWHASRNVRRDQEHFIDLSSRQATEGHHIHQTLGRPASGMVRVSADADLAHVKGGDSHQRARIDLYGRKVSGKWQWLQNLFTAVGTVTLTNVSRVIPVSEEFTEIRVEAELTGGTGTFLVDRISLIEVESRLSVKYLTHVLLACWVALGCGIVVVLVRLKLLFPVGLMAVVAILLLLIPESFKLEILDRLNYWIPGTDYVPLDHLLLFFLASVIIYYSTRRVPGAGLWQVTLSLITFSLVTEILQYYTVHRDPGLQDGIVNLVGILAAVAVFRILEFSRKAITRAQGADRQ